MSVVIKGMDMPDSCIHCCMKAGTFCDVLNIDVDPFYDGEKHRNVCCPLVELPEKHGDLIDRDALPRDVMDFDVWNASVVIEAEGGTCTM